LICGVLVVFLLNYSENELFSLDAMKLTSSNLSFNYVELQTKSHGLVGPRYHGTTS